MAINQCPAPHTYPNGSTMAIATHAVINNVIYMEVVYLGNVEIHTWLTYQEAYELFPAAVVEYFNDAPSEDEEPGLFD